MFTVELITKNNKDHIGIFLEEPNMSEHLGKYLVTVKSVGVWRRIVEVDGLQKAMGDYRNDVGMRAAENEMHIQMVKDALGIDEMEKLKEEVNSGARSLNSARRKLGLPESDDLRCMRKPFEVIDGFKDSEIVAKTWFETFDINYNQSVLSEKLRWNRGL